MMEGQLFEGVPPERPGVEGAVVASTRKKSTQKSTTSTASSVRRRKEVQATRDEMIVKLRMDYAEKLKAVKIHETKINSAKRKLDAAMKRFQENQDPGETVEIVQLQDSIQDLQDDVEILKAELESIETTQEDKIQAIRSRCEANLESISSDDETSISLESDEEGRAQRVRLWTSKCQQQDIEDRQDGDKIEHLRTDEVSLSYDISTNHNNESIHSSTFLKSVDFPDEDVLHARRQSNLEYEDRVRNYWWRSREIPSFLQQDSRPRHKQNQDSQEVEIAEHNEPKTTVNNPKRPKPSENTLIDGGTNTNVVKQLVSALGQAFGGQRNHAMKGQADSSLPKFNGNPSDWENFKCEYLRTCTKYKFEDSENVTRLRLSLEGDALNAVKHLMANPSNLCIILETLEKRFGRPEFVLDYLVEKAKTTKSPDPNKPETMIEFGTAIEALVTNICAYNQYEYMGNRQLVNEFVGKLTPALRTQWHEWQLDDTQRRPNLKYFYQWLSRKVDAAIMAVKPKVTLDSQEQERRWGRNRTQGVVNVASGGSENQTCLCCGKRYHAIEKCWKFEKMLSRDRWQLVRDNNLCLCCLKGGHRSRKCPDNAKCSKDGCDYYHHIMLHFEQKEKTKRAASPLPTNGSAEQETSSGISPVTGAGTPGSLNSVIIEGTDGPLQIVPVKIKKPNGKGSMVVHAMLDIGASRSLILKTLARDLGLEGQKIKPYRYKGIDGGMVEVANAMNLNCEIAGVYRGAEYQPLVNAVTVDRLPLTAFTFNKEEAIKVWPHFKQMKSKSLKKVVPQLIIGNNNPDLILPNRVVRGDKGGPLALRTVLGWTVAGNFDVEPGHGRIQISMCGEEATDDYLHDLIKKSFSTEDFGVKPIRSKGTNLEEKRAWRILDQTTRNVNGIWETGLLWREDNVRFPESESYAKVRLQYTEKKMADPLYRAKYHAKIAEYLDKGYIRKLSLEEAAVRPAHTKYIPHFGQINPNKPDKFRFILDAKAKANGLALNDKLSKGPDLIRPLVAVLWNFRIHQIALTGDIADMFHRVKIREEDQCSQRLLWRDGDPSKPPDHYQMQVMMFGATSSPSSAIYVKNRNANTFKEKYPHAAQVIVSDYYVDDMLTGGNTVKEVIELRQQVSEIMKAGNFSVCKFMSNSSEVLASIPEDLKAEGVKGVVDKEDLPSERVLGLWWNPNDDVFTFKLAMHKVKQRVFDLETPTKREMCGLIMSLYDPIGFISHYKIKGLVLLQDVWRAGVGWDDEIPAEVADRWRLWMSMLGNITNVQVPRCYSGLLSTADEIQLHIFQDASEQSFAAICYLRIKMWNNVEIAFVGSKARVAPLKKLTIPKLELQAAVLGTRLAKTLGEELRVPISSRWFWSDSKTVLCWIRSTGVRYPEFVANRIGEIQEDTNSSEWHWVPTKLNVADQATRFESKISFDPDSEFYSGPAFLKLEPSEFPQEEREEIVVAAVSLGNDLDETRKLSQNGSHCTTAIVPDPKRFSSYLRLVRATAATIKCATLWWNKLGKQKSATPFKLSAQSNVSANGMQAAESLLIRLAQKEAYSEEIECLRMGKPITKKSHIWRLLPFLDEDGIMRLNGRIGAAIVPDDVKFPVILPTKHYITQLIIDAEHGKCGHQGAETVLCNLRQRFWIPEGRKAVQRSWTRCQVCRLNRVKPIPPRMANLPHFRLASNQPPFTFTGLDFFGPMEVTVGRRHEKRWGALFCCEVTRAVHLEICHGLSTDEAIMAISRFVDVRGRCRYIKSDNGTNFVGAAKELKENIKKLDFEKIMGFGKFHEIRWSFNPPAAPHMGGSWERLVQTVKKCLKAILYEKFPKDTTLLTVLKSVENIVNSRPLTHVSCDPADPEAITPNHFLRGGVDFGPGIPAQMDPSDDYLRAQWRRAQLMADQFWERWTREFLPKLLTREKWHDTAEPMQVGELVYMVDKDQPRNCWIRGFISAVYPGSDGQVRVVDVTTRDFATKKSTIYKRPVTKLCPLGLKMEIQNPVGS